MQGYWRIKSFADISKDFVKILRTSLQKMEKIGCNRAVGTLYQI